MSEQIAAYQEEKERFAVTDEASAEWCLEKIEENAKGRALIEEQYEQMTARYEKWRADALAEIESNDLYLKGLLEPWAAEKMGDEKIEATTPALLAFVKQDDDSFVKVQESVRWGEYKKTLRVMEDGRVVSATGQIIEGMTVTQGAPSFYVDIEGR